MRLMQGRPTLFTPACPTPICPCQSVQTSPYIMFFITSAFSAQVVRFSVRKKCVKCSSLGCTILQNLLCQASLPVLLLDHSSVWILERRGFMVDFGVKHFIFVKTLVLVVNHTCLYVPIPFIILTWEGQLCWGSPPLFQGHLTLTKAAAWHISHLFLIEGLRWAADLWFVNQ